MPVFAQYNLFGPNVYMCYDYVHLDNLSYISAYRNHNVQQCKTSGKGLAVVNLTLLQSVSDVLYAKHNIHIGRDYGRT